MSTSKTPYAEHWLQGPQSTSFYTRLYLPSSSSNTVDATRPKAALIYVHGFVEHVGRYNHLHSYFADHGIAVFAFDQRGFGKTALDLEHKSPGSSFGKTSGKDQLIDVEWAITHTKEEMEKRGWDGVKLFLMGHSMGGGIVLSFATRTSEPPAKSTVSLLSGVIASSPLVLLTKPVPTPIRWIASKAGGVLPYMRVKAEVFPEDLSHDPKVAEDNKNDPLCKPYGTIRGLDDMLRGGENLLASEYKQWPKSLPILFVHGTADNVNSVKATEELYNRIDASDKHLSLYPDGYHELHNETDDIKTKLFAEYISWINAHLGSGAPQLPETAVDEGMSKL